MQEIVGGRTVWGPMGGRGDTGPCCALLRKEIRRADRQREVISLISLKFDSIDDIRSKFGGIAADHFEKEIGILMHGILRDHDHLGELGRGKYIIILPVTDEGGVEKFLTRFERILAAYRFDVHDFTSDGSAGNVEVKFELRYLTHRPVQDTTTQQIIDLGARPTRSSLQGAAPPAPKKSRFLRLVS